MKRQLETKSGKNFFEIASLIQKAVRRADYERAGYCANELVDQYPGYLWRKLFIISAEDCFGAVTKEILKLYNESMKSHELNHKLVSRAVIVLCQCRKNKDADYFGCNFMHSERAVPAASIKEYIEDFKDKAICMSFLDSGIYSKNGHDLYDLANALQKSIVNKHFAKAGYVANELMETDNDFLWSTLISISEYEFGGELTEEIKALKRADAMQKEREKIFPGKAISLMCQSTSEHELGFFDWDYQKAEKVIPKEIVDGFAIENCILPNDEIPDWVFSWHTSKGKRMGRDCVDSIIDDQLALTPLQTALFDRFDWAYHINRSLYKHNPKNRPHVGINWDDVYKNASR